MALIRASLTPPAAVADHQPPTVLSAFIAQRPHVVIDLGLKRRRDHLASTLPREVIKRDPHLLIVSGLGNGQRRCR